MSDDGPDRVFQKGSADESMLSSTSSGNETEESLLSELTMPMDDDDVDVDDEVMIMQCKDGARTTAFNSPRLSLPRSHWV